MIVAVRLYFEELLDKAGTGWNQFWYRPATGWQLVWLRQIVALFAFIWLISFSAELTEMFGSDGWVSTQTIHQTTTGGDLAKSAPGFSHMFLVSSSVGLWVCHVIGLLILGCAVLGYAPRWTTPMSLLVVLSYIHRSTVLVGPFEAVLCMLLLYLCLAPRQRLSLGSLRSPRQLTPEQIEPSWTSRISARLIQLHLCAFYLLIATSKLGTIAWWSGMAPVAILLDEHRRLINLESLADSDYLMDAVAHAWVAFELSFPILVWIRLLRPLLLGIAAVVWVLTAFVTGQVGYCLLMAIASLAFLDEAPSAS